VYTEGYLGFIGLDLPGLFPSKLDSLRSFQELSVKLPKLPQE
jgi:hypothetical protein